MIIKFPLFMKDREGWMYLLFSEKDINDYLEPVDIEDKEYYGWDIEGRPVELFMEDKRIKAKYISEDRDLDAIKAAILHYANIGTEVSFDYKEIDRNLIKLFKAVENHIRNNRKGFLDRLRDKFRGIYKEIKEGVFWALGVLLFINLSFLLKVDTWENKRGLFWVLGGCFIFFVWLNIIIIRLALRVIRKRDFRKGTILGLIWNIFLMIFGWIGFYYWFRFLLTLWSVD